MAGSLKTLIAMAAIAGLAGCAYQDPLAVPNPYATHGSRPGGTSSPYFFYGGMSPYPQYYGYGAADPYSYYRYGYPTYRYGYPTYGYYSYPRYPVHYCPDVNRDGRCDRNDPDHDGDDDGDHDHDGHNGQGDHDGRGNDHSGAGPGHDRPAVPRDRPRFVPDSRGTERPVPRSNSNAGGAGMVPRAAPPAATQPPAPPRSTPTPPRSTTAPPRSTTAPPRSTPDADDPAPPPRLRPAESR